MKNIVKLISEEATYDYDLIFEQENSNAPKKLKIKGPFLVAEKRNGNKRKYTSRVLESAVGLYEKDYITRGLSFGETNHPDSPEVSFERACIKTEKLERNGNIWIGEATVLMSVPELNIKGTILGDNLAAILQYGGRPGVSSRGVGKIDEDNVINEVYKLLAMDVVYTPSGPGCYVDGILESKSFMIDNHGDAVEIAYNHLVEDLSKSSVRQSTQEVYLKLAFDNFLTNIGRI
jgi:hypothetical protein